MSKTPKREAIATGVKHGGKVLWDDPIGFSDTLKMMPDGSVVVRVELASPNAIRSLRANRYYFGVVLEEIRKYTEQDKDDIHDFMCARFLGHKVFLVNRETGAATEREVAGRSSSLSPQDFWDFVEHVRLFANEFFGLRIPDPDPAWRLRDLEAA